MNDLWNLSATEAAGQIRRNSLTSESLVTACLERIRARDDTIKAWVHLDPELALTQARERDAAQRAAKPLGRLHGIPVGIKDIIDTAALPTENGTPVFAGRQPGTDARVVQLLIAEGAVILGKTVTTELAFFGPGKTRNPHDPTRTPGGSSSGSAAAVADYHVPLALGTQTAGSIIRPASYCGVLGMKPTFGTVPRDGVLEQSPPLDTIGGYARSAADMALLMATLVEPQNPDLERRTNFSRPPRFAFVKSPSWPEGEPEMQAAFANLQSKKTDIIKEVDLPALFQETSGLQKAVQFRDIARNYGPILDANPGIMSDKLAEVIAAGRTVSDDGYQEALAMREPLYQSLAPILSDYDAILTPAATGVAPVGLDSTGSPIFNFLWTYLGMPAVSIPLLKSNNLPLGVQLVGARGADAKLLSAASALLGDP